MAPDFAPAVLGYARCLCRLAEAVPEPVFHWARWAARAQGNRFYEMKALHHLAVRLGDRGALGGLGPHGPGGSGLGPGAG